jgi:CBS domain containing-hemolysin-like protein
MFTQMVLFSLLSIVVAFVLATGEAAIFRMSRVRAQELAEEGRTGSRSLTKVVADSAAYLSVLAFLRVVAEATCAVFITVAVLELVDRRDAALAISIVVMAVVSFVVVGVSPRTLGRQNFDTIALWAAPVAVGLRKVLGPLSRILVALGNAVTPGKGYRDGPFQSEAELRDLLDIAGDTAVIEEDEREMIHSVFELGDTVVREVMVPRTDMVTISLEKNLRQAMSLFLRSGFSRIPVVGEDSDDARGLLYLKDVTRRTYADPGSAHTSVEQVMRPVQFVPESKPVDDLLREMQRDQSHFAMVVDEYGGIAGVVTIEDILEEIVGEIDDEYDRESPGVEELEDGSVRVPAAMSIDDLADLFHVTIDEEEVDTVGGLLAKTIGRVPIPGSHAGVAGLSLTAEKMAGRRHRIATIIVRPVEPPPEPTEDEPATRRLLDRGSDREPAHER